MDTSPEVEDSVVVRSLQPGDLERVIAIDAHASGRRREEYFRVKLAENLDETGIRISLAAEVDGLFAGFLLARLYYGEFGLPEPVAVLDTLGVHPDYRRRGVGSALLRQLQRNLRGLRVTRLQTEVGWEDLDLLGFFHRQGFAPAPRLCLDLTIDPKGETR